MKTRVVLFAVGLGLAFTGPAFTKPAMGKRMMRMPPSIAPGDVAFHTEFAVLDATPQMRASNLQDDRTTTSTSIAATENGGVLVIDDETGTLSLLDKVGKPLGSVNVGRRAGQMAVDRKRNMVFVANRAGDTIEVLKYDASSQGNARQGNARQGHAQKGHALTKKARFVTGAEPFGVALTPDGTTLLVTTVAGRALQAFASDTGDVLWSIDIGPEARAVAVSPDSKEAVVSFLGSGAIARIALDTQRLRFEAIGATRTVTEEGVNFGRSKNVPQRFARNAFAATFVGDTAVVAYQQSTPKAIAVNQRESRGTYGGSAEGNPPLVHHLAFMPRGWNSPGRAHVRMQMPRAIAYDAAQDELLIADLATDEVIRIGHATKGEMAGGQRFSLQQAPNAKGVTEVCGPKGVATTDDGNVVVHCSLSKQVAFVNRGDNNSISFSPVLAESKMSAAAKRGRILFHKGGDARLSSRGGMACANCHPEGRNDGLSWRIEGTDLQTPLLAGRMKGTHPFKWDGQDKDLHTSLMHTVVRLGGHGIQSKDAKDLQAYLESMEGVRVTGLADGTLSAKQHRGKALFNSKELGCRTCHSGKNYSDGKSYDLGDDLDKVNTPSLIGLAASAPYYHDGSAPNLRALVLGNASVRGMGHMENLDDKEVDELIAFLETL
jgi:DNA-binding beta-propeller fold protein YncE